MFVVIYSRKLAPEQEALLCEGWTRVTQALYHDRGSLGSRLHEGEDDVWVAYAQWPDRATWERSRRLGAADTAGLRMMEEATLERFPTSMAHRCGGPPARAAARNVTTDGSWAAKNGC